MLEHLQKTLLRSTIIAYLDDIYILNPKPIPLLPIVIRAFKESLIALNKEKSYKELIAKLRVSGIKALETFIGLVLYRRTFLQSKINTLRCVITTL